MLFIVGAANKSNLDSATPSTSTASRSIPSGSGSVTDDQEIESVSDFELFRGRKTSTLETRARQEREKRKLQIDVLELQKEALTVKIRRDKLAARREEVSYHRERLECLKLERELGIVRSEYRVDLPRIYENEVSSILLTLQL